MTRGHRHNFKRTFLISLGLLAGLFVLANIAVGFIYSQRTYPGTRLVQNNIGNVRYSDLRQTVERQQFLPATLQLGYGSQQVTTPTRELGISLDVTRSLASARQQRSWLPLINLFRKPQLKAPVAFDQGQLEHQADSLASFFQADPVDAHLTLTKGSVGIAKGTAGYTLDKQKLQQAILAGLDKGQATIQIPVARHQPRVSEHDLAQAKQQLQLQIDTSVKLTYRGHTATADRAAIGSWYVQSGDAYAVNLTQVKLYLGELGKSFGITIKDLSKLAATLAANVEKHRPTALTVSAQTPLKTFNYCVGARGVSVAALDNLKSLLKATYADPRGWNLDGKVAFKEVTSGCDYTVWLSSASQMPSFGGVCDSMWNCRSGSNVIVNDTRWEQASDAWNAARAGSIDDYRAMIINHETGHWLGFAHRHCTAAGQPAPVMEQQSIDLEGCTFNPWPTAPELQTLQSSLKL